MHSLVSLSLFLAVCQAVIFPFEVRTTDYPVTGLARRAATGSVPVTNNGNAQYIANMTLGGQTARVLLDTGSSDLWVNFPGTAPTTKDLGKSITLNYAIGAAVGSINTATMVFDNFTVQDQAFLLVTDASSFSSNIHKQGYDGLMGLGPNEGSSIFDKVDSSAGDSPLMRIFEGNSLSSNYITFLLDRKGVTSNFTGQLTVSEIVPGFEAINNMPKMDVETVHKLLDQDQHWQALTDKDIGIIGPDGQVIPTDSIVPKAPDGQLVVVFDSGFTFNQVPRDVSDAIYGRVQGAVYDSTHEWWTVPCGQMLNISINMGGHTFPIHPLDTVDNSFGITDANGNTVCIGTFQPITTAFSLLGNYDMIMGMSFLRNAYTLLNYGSWVKGGEDVDPYIQLLPLTDVQTAHADFVTSRLSGTDTTGAAKWNLLPADQMQHSPVSAEEKKKKYQEMILSRWPYIFVGCLAFVLIIAGLIIWKCCCRKRIQRRREAKAMKAPSQGFMPVAAQSSPYLPSTKDEYPQDSQQNFNNHESHQFNSHDLQQYNSHDQQYNYDSQYNNQQHPQQYNHDSQYNQSQYPPYKGEY
ncbi:aspartic peptidase domain-containing protein [Mycena floridula]|nr:aspartic peptidase domain-containing protein [Mycena floridula]